MASRPKKPEIPLFRDLTIEDVQGNTFTLKKIEIKCPICGSTHVHDDGTKRSGNTRLQSYQCKNSECFFLENHKQGKQFTIFSSLYPIMIVEQYLQNILQKIGKSKGKLSTIGNFFALSSS